MNVEEMGETGERKKKTEDKLVLPAELSQHLSHHDWNADQAQVN
jgi:hypothetical protein